MFKPTFYRKWVLPFLLFEVSLLLASSVFAAEMPFDEVSLQGFSTSERLRIAAEYLKIQQAVFQDRKPSEEAQPVYVATAGPNGALQSVVFKDILDQYPFSISSDIDKSAASLVNLMYQPFDCRQVLSSYVPSNVPYYNKTLDSLNTKFRAISHCMTSKILQKAFSERFHVAHLSTSTDINIEKRYRWLKANNYKIVLFLCGTMEFEVLAAFKGQKFIGEKNQYTVESLQPPDAEAFKSCLSTYFKYADEIHLHWTHNLDLSSTKAAVYDVKRRFLVIKNGKAYKSFMKRYPLFWAASKQYFEMI